MVIRIDYDRCLGPEKCGKCMYICPLGVFMSLPEGKFNPKKRPENFFISPFFQEICNGCRACVKICPTKCITLEGERY